MLPKIDFLKENADKIHYFGLGFIQIKMKDPSLRFHFYHEFLNTTAQEEEIHNHRKAFESTILRGTLNQKIYSVVGTDTKSDYVLSNVSCNPDKPLSKAMRREIKVAVVPHSEHTYHEGASYKMFPQVFHRVHSKFAITQLLMGPEVKEFAQVIHRTGDPLVCPFSKPIPEDKLWETVEDMLK